MQSRVRLSKEMKNEITSFQHTWQCDNQMLQDMKGICLASCVCMKIATCSFFCLHTCMACHFLGPRNISCVCVMTMILHT